MSISFHNGNPLDNHNNVLPFEGFFGHTFHITRAAIPRRATPAMIAPIYAAKFV